MMMPVAGRDRAQDVDARQGGSVLVPGPPHQGEDAARLKGNDAPLAVDDVLIDASTESDFGSRPVSRSKRARRG
jgi:hypothetical protein